jgi:hypothetical protein
MQRIKWSGVVAVMVTAVMARPSGSRAASDYLISDVINTSGQFEVIGLPVINNGGTLAFFGSKDPIPFSPREMGMYVWRDGQMSPLYLAGSSFFLSDLSINDAGQVAFIHGALNEHYLRSGTDASTLTLVADTTGPFRSPLSELEVTNSGELVFQGRLDGQDTLGIYRGPDPVVDRIADAQSGVGLVSLMSVAPDDTVFFRGGQGLDRAVYKPGNNGPELVFDFDDTRYNNASGYRENASGQRVFSAFVRDEGFVEALFTGPDIVADRIVDTSGAFNAILNASITRNGTIVFQADLDNGATGIFVGPDPVEDKVVAEGDPLFGSTIANLNIGDEGVNDLGQVAFWYRLANGVEGVAVAWVPEPSGVGVLLLAAAAALGRRRAKR